MTDRTITIEQAEAALTADERSEIFGWKMYDWGWSAFSTTVTTALLGPYLLALGEDAGGVRLLGYTIDEASFYPYVVSLSALLQIIVLPLVGAAADYTDRKKKLMLGLSYLGSIADGRSLLRAGTHHRSRRRPLPRGCGGVLGRVGDLQLLSARHRSSGVA